MTARSSPSRGAPPSPSTPATKEGNPKKAVQNRMAALQAAASVLEEEEPGDGLIVPFSRMLDSAAGSLPERLAES